MKYSVILVKVTIVMLCSFLACSPITERDSSVHDMSFNQLATSWDEAVPLGNGMLGSLVWQKGENLRFSLDRADLWDLRPMENLEGEKFSYEWVFEQWKNNSYHLVQESFDHPYDQKPAPSKIPGAALEFNIKDWGKADSVRLIINEAICEVYWSKGIKLQTFVHATQPVGWFRFENLTEDIVPVLIPPAYNLKGDDLIDSPVSGQDLRRLAYPEGLVTTDEKHILYEQEGWGGFKYLVDVRWKKKGDVLEGCWSISSSFPNWEKQPSADDIVAAQLTDGFQKSFRDHQSWWSSFWTKSSIQLPDKLLEKQWYLEQYKFGSAARQNAPPISLQAVWTADNGRLPPWKGDFHHDLNTQLSYWPAYSGNHLDLEQGFVDWLWKYRDTFKEYTKMYYGVEGLNVPGVTTLTGDPMGGWIQYSFGPTVGAWLGHHFYLHWRYTMDRDFLEEKAYPWIKEVAQFFNAVAIEGADGKLQLPISSSPEINNNSREAWFDKTTNFDLSLIRWTYEKAIELAIELDLEAEAIYWEDCLSQWPGFAIDDSNGLMFSPDLGYHESHRHFSHLMAIHPLGLIDWSQGEESRDIISNTINNLENVGTDWWVGYSFSWMGNLQARMLDGQGAANTLHLFAENFCSINTFHVNGEQHNKGYSKFKYRPFTLEGNFAFASAIQEMLIQSHTPIVKIFPAIPDHWRDVSFQQLRTEGAFLVSAERKQGMLSSITVESEKDGIILIENTFPGKKINCPVPYIEKDGVISIQMHAGETITIRK